MEIDRNRKYIGTHTHKHTPTHTSLAGSPASACFIGISGLDKFEFFCVFVSWRQASTEEARRRKPPRKVKIHQAEGKSEGIT